MKLNRKKPNHTETMRNSLIKRTGYCFSLNKLKTQNFDKIGNCSR